MRQPPSQHCRLLILTLIATLVFAGCRPDDRLDITPSPTPTPQPTATPSPTPAPVDFVDPYEVNQSVMERLIELLPNPLAAGEEQWKRNYEVGDEGVESILGVRRPAVGKAIYFYTQQGSKMSLNFVVFPDEDGAIGELERKRDLRSSLVNLAEDEAFPKPNFIGAGPLRFVRALPDRQLFHRGLRRDLHHLDKPAQAAVKRHAALLRE